MNSKNKTWGWIVIIGLIIIGGIWYTRTSGQVAEIANPVATPTMSPLGQNMISIVNTEFIPSNHTIKAGETITWLNNDSMTHKIVANNKSFSSPVLEKGQKFSYKFNNSGTFHYTCSLHPNLKGTILVTK